MKSGRFGVAVAPFWLRFGPSESKWVQDLKKLGFGVPGVTWGSNRAIFGFPGHFAPPWPSLGCPYSVFFAIFSKRVHFFGQACRLGIFVVSEAQHYTAFAYVRMSGFIIMILQDSPG